MTGITKFFKPTGTIGSAKKPGDAPASAARSPFAPLGNTEGIVRATIRPVNEADDDVVLVEQEVPTSSKRKREDLKNAAGAAGCSERAAPSTSVPRMQPLDVVQKNEAMTAAPAGEAQPAAGDADVEMSSQQQRAGAEEPSSLATGRCEALVDAPITCAAIAEAPASSAQPTVEPTPKRQRLPASVAAADADNVCDADADADGTASTSTRQQHDRAHNHHNHSQHNQAASGSAAIAPQQQQQQTAGRAGSHTPAGATTGTGTDAQPSCSQQSVEGASGAAGGGIGGGATGAAPGSAGGVVGGKDGAGCTGGGGKSGGAGPATLPEGLDLAETAETLRGEAAELESALEEEMLLDSGLATAAAAAESGRLALTPSAAELCAWLEGRTTPLGPLLEQQLLPLLPAGTDAAALRTTLIDLAARRCYSAKDVALEAAAAADDATPGRLWVWEVREPKKHLADKASRKIADLQRKRRKELRERLVATLAAADALAAHAALLEPPAAGAKPPTAAARRTSESRAAKAWNRLCRLATRAAVEETYRSAASSLMTAGGSAAATLARKERERKEKEDAKQRQKEEKEEAKARAKEEAKAKEAKRLAEEEARRKAKEVKTAAKEAAKAGFASSTGLKKSQNLMDTFFKRSGSKPTGGAAAAPAPAADPAAAVPAASADGDGGAVSGLQQQQQPGASGPAGTPQPRAGATPPGRGAPEASAGVAPAAAAGGGAPATGGATGGAAAGPRMMFNFNKVERRIPDAAVVAALDADAARLPLPASELAVDFRAAHGRWRQQRADRRRMLGVPPTWARRPGAPTDLRALAAAYYGDVGALGLEPTALRTWRRKLIAFPKEESVRPPYYGSFSRSSAAVTGRRPFGRDTGVDYEVASDDEWEEEPEGESLSDSGDEADSQAGGGGGGGGEEEEEDGFIVGDDHLSDDEGAQLSGDEDAMEVDGAAKTPRAAAAAAAVTSGHVRFMDPRLQQLEAAIDRVRTNNRPILLVRPPPAAPAAGADGGQAVAAAAAALRAEPRPGLNTGLDPGLLGALRPVVHRPDVALAPPLELDVYSAYAAAATGGGAAAAAGWDGAVAVAAAAPAAREDAGAGVAVGAARVSMGGAGVVGGSAARAGGGGAGRGGGRPASAPLGEADLTALALYMSACQDKRADKIVEGFLASLPPAAPGAKQPAKVKLRDAVKRLGAWSASAKRWLLHGGDVAAAVAAALAAQQQQQAAAAAAAAAATAAAAAAAAVGSGVSPLPALTPHGSLTPLAAGGGGNGSTPLGVGGTPLLPPGPPAPTPMPQLRAPLPSPMTGQGPLLLAPACTPAEQAAAAAAATNTTPHNHHQQQQPLPSPALLQPPLGAGAVPPSQLAQALARTAAEAGAAPLPTPSPAPTAGGRQPTPSTSGLEKGRSAAAAVAGSRSILDLFNRTKARASSGGGGAATAAAAGAAPAATAADAAQQPMECDGAGDGVGPAERQQQQQQPAAASGRAEGEGGGAADTSGGGGELDAHMEVCGETGQCQPSIADQQQQQQPQEQGEGQAAPRDATRQQSQLSGGVGAAGTTPSANVDGDQRRAAAEEEEQAERGSAGRRDEAEEQEEREPAAASGAAAPAAARGPIARPM